MPLQDYILFLKNVLENCIILNLKNDFGCEMICIRVVPNKAQFLFSKLIQLV